MNLLTNTYSPAVNWLQPMSESSYFACSIDVNKKDIVIDVRLEWLKNGQRADPSTCINI